MAKLGITSAAGRGRRAMTLSARVEVCSTSQYAEPQGRRRTASLSLQITAMELSGAAESSPSTASLLYPGS
jgi:hypothetical protein